MNFCNFECVETQEQDIVKCKCSYCNNTLTMPQKLSDDKPLIPCNRTSNQINNKTEPPRFFTKFKNFIVALYQHIKSGRKRSSPFLRRKRYKICQDCDLFDGNICTKCGCPIKAKANFISKLDWADQHCPIGKW